MRGLQWIILAIVAVNVIGAIVKGLSKNQQKEREAELAAQRRQAAVRQAQQRPQTTASSQRPGGQQSGSYPTGRPLDTLAQRRKEQLEQLRQRRQQRTAHPPTQARASTTTSTGGKQHGGLQVSDSASLAEKMERTQQAEQRLQQRREQASQARARQAREKQERLRKTTKPARKTAGRRAAVPAALRPAERKPSGWPEGRPGTMKAASSLEEPYDAYAVVGSGEISQFARSIRRQMRNPVTLRQLFVLKELLDSPVSLRPGGFGE